MAPVVQHRFGLGHMSLLAHWSPIFALALCFTAKSHRFDTRTIACFTGLTLLATFIHLYIYVMTAAVAASAILQALIDRRISLQSCLISVGLLLVAGIFPLWISWAFSTLETWRARRDTVSGCLG